MFVMNDKQVAVSEVILRLLHAADDYDHGSGALSDPELTESFAARGMECRDTAKALEPHIRQLGELPPRPDPEREALDRFLNRIANIGVDERSRLAEALGERESAIEQAAADALLQPLPEDTLHELRRIRAMAREQTAKLAGLVREV